jgi:hypothetical protein
VRSLSLLARLRAAVYLGIAGIGLQAALPLFLAFSIASVERASGIDYAGRSAIHRQHADHSSGSPHHPTHHSGHQHTNCILCQGLQAAGTATLPTALALTLPLGELAGRTTPEPTIFHVFGSPAAYASRAPPSIG